MTGNGSTVVLCKGLSEGSDKQEAYVRTLESAGYTCDLLQTLRFEFVNISELQTCLSMPDKYTGLILTSPRTVEAIAMAAKDNTNILHHWEQMPAYCVGPATESVARTQLSLQRCIGSQSGNSRELAERIVLDVTKVSKPLLYPCSEIARETIASVLNDRGVSVEKIIVYKTLESKSLERDLLEILRKSPNIFFVFFSPSTVEHVAAQLKRNSYSIRNIKAVAIGPVTRDALTNLDFNVCATADKPEPAALMRAIVTADEYEKLEERVS